METTTICNFAIIQGWLGKLGGYTGQGNALDVSGTHAYFIVFHACNYNEMANELAKSLDKTMSSPCSGVCWQTFLTFWEKVGAS